MRILPIVEGEGDEEAVPELLRRLAYDLERFDVTICPAQRRGDLPKVKGRFEAFFRTAALEEAAIFWVMDYDCQECTDQARHVEELKALARRIDSRQRIEFVFMVQEFETLFLADWATTCSVFSDISVRAPAPTNPESIRDAKGYLSKARPKGSAYKPTQHQKRLAAQVNFDRLRACSPSFNRFEAAVQALLR